MGRSLHMQRGIPRRFPAPTPSHTQCLGIAQKETRGNRPTEPSLSRAHSQAPMPWRPPTIVALSRRARVECTHAPHVHVLFCQTLPHRASPPPCMQSPLLAAHMESTHRMSWSPPLWLANKFSSPLPNVLVVVLLLDVAPHTRRSAISHLFGASMRLYCRCRCSWHRRLMSSHGRTSPSILTRPKQNPCILQVRNPTHGFMSKCPFYPTPTFCHAQATSRAQWRRGHCSPGVCH